MPFNQNDNYVSGGSIQLYDAWTRDVNKHDTSSFYNWEQDNIPLLDLEERSNLLWEKTGYSASNLDNMGITLVVSSTATAPPTHLNIYSSISDAIDALPDVIRCPILIEVAMSSVAGNKGEIKLQNLKFERKGALEIINRFGVRIHSELNSTIANGSGALSINPDSDPNVDGYYSYFSSMDFSSCIDSASAVSIGVKLMPNNPVVEGLAWRNPKIFLQTTEHGSVSNRQTANLTFSNKSANLFTGTSANVFALDVSGGDLDIDVTVSAGLDFVLVNELDSTVGIRRNVGNSANVNSLQGLAYANYLSGITVENCGGPIFIRNFLVYNATGTTYSNFKHIRDHGIIIKNSNVVLENCATARNKQTGLYVENSTVVLNRGFIAYRNYDWTYGSGTNLECYRNRSKPSAGILGINSHIIVSSTADAINNNSAANDEFVYGRSYLFACVRQDVGMELINSRFSGGRSRVSDSNGIKKLTNDINNSNRHVNFLHFYHNNEYGIKATNSVIDTKARLVIFENNVGIRAEEATLKLQEYNIERNQKEGIQLINSTLVNNPYLFNVSSFNSVVGSQFWMQYNGKHILADNSDIVMPEASASVMVHTWPASSIFGMGSLYGRTYLRYTHGAVEHNDGSKVAIPAISILNNSKAKFINTRIDIAGNPGTADYFKTNGDAVYGAFIEVKNNSKATFHGTASGTSLFIGPRANSTVSISEMRNVAGIYAGGNSIVTFRGPTIIQGMGVDVLAEDHSIINFIPHITEDGVPSIYNWQLSDTNNHTKVELHSLRSCLVANKKSTINMQDLGSYGLFWSGTDIANILVTSGGADVADYDPQNNFGLRTTVSGGYMQFYPNPQTGNNTFDSSNPAVMAFNPPGGWNATTRTLITNGPIATGDDHLVISYGGVCLRAVGDSEVNVRNVNFPAGWANPSGAFYDLSGNGCNKLYIWNIADTSRLYATHCSVAAAWPASSVYHGPSAVYTAPDNITVMSGCPSTTPHTSSISVLDSFGLSAAIPIDPTDLAAGYRAYGKSTFDNRGPFRLYFSPLGPAKFLGYASGPANNPDILLGIPYQVLAQGYNPSGDCSAANTYSMSGPWSGTGAIYQEIYPGFKEADGFQNPASAFFYVSSMLDPNTRTRIFLDDSTMNLFANAKNATLGTSGRLKLVTYIRSTIVSQGEGWDSNAINYGLGFLSANTFDLRRRN